MKTPKSAKNEEARAFAGEAESLLSEKSPRAAE
jgi:hypothetical protein